MSEKAKALLPPKVPRRAPFSVEFFAFIARAVSRAPLSLKQWPRTPTPDALPLMSMAETAEYVEKHRIKERPRRRCSRRSRARSEDPPRHRCGL